ncbi:MAG: hypothetical protein IJ347_03650 [Faecalibacterium sp.]|nr:hypothetical protein [Faecalibacterium sp.]
MGWFSDLLSGFFPNNSSSGDGFSKENYDRDNERFIARFCQKFDLTSVKSIEEIDVEETRWWSEHAPGVPSFPESILSKKATEYKRAKAWDLAIACLKKANELKRSSQYIYAEKDYMRLVRYLRDAGRFEEAAEEEKRIAREFGHEVYDAAHKSRSQEKAGASTRVLFGETLASQMKAAHDTGTDLVEVGWVDVCCEACGKYRGRIFSLSGRSARFPKFPDDFDSDCGCSVYPFFEGMSKPQYFTMKQLAVGPKHKFVDGRTAEQKIAYEAKIVNEAQEEKDRADYAWLQQYLPDRAPKSYSGYRRMKNIQSKNYLALQKLAEEQGRHIG